jgi:hypothetical protein
MDIPINVEDDLHNRVHYIPWLDNIVKQEAYGLGCTICVCGLTLSVMSNKKIVSKINNISTRISHIYPFFSANNDDKSSLLTRTMVYK